jgi:hypothetical protein
MMMMKLMNELVLNSEGVMQFYAVLCVWLCIRRNSCFFLLLYSADIHIPQYQEMCVRYYEWFGWKSREESKKAMDYTGDDQ